MPKPQTTYLVGIIQFLGHTEKRPEGIRSQTTNTAQLYYPLGELTAIECEQLVELMKKRYPIETFPIDDVRKGYVASFRLAVGTELDDTAKQAAELAKLNSRDETEGPWSYQVQKYIDRIRANRPAAPKIDALAVADTPPEAADDIPKSKRASQPSRVKAKAVYDFAMSKIARAEDMTIVELFNAIQNYSGDLPRGRHPAECLPCNAETFRRYLNDCGIKRYSARAGRHASRSIQRANKL